MANQNAIHMLVVNPDTGAALAPLRTYCEILLGRADIVCTSDRSRVTCRVCKEETK